MLKEFREFALRGNVLDLAVAVVIGGAFGAIVTSLVDDVINPLIGFLIGGTNLANLFTVVADGDPAGPYASLDAAKAAGAAVIGWGAFLNAIVSFLLVAFALFLVVKAANALRRAATAEEEATERECPFCLTAVPVKATRCPACTSELGPAS